MREPAGHGAGALSDAQLLRYSRQILLPQIDVGGQERICRARVLIIGLGGLGSPVAMYLAAAGVGRLRLADGDAVDLSNLQRQIVHGSADLGRRKVESARERLLALNPEVVIETLDHELRDRTLAAAIDSVDAVVDATDNFAARFAINAACVEAGVPLVSGAALRFEGQVSVFMPWAGPHAPCYRCLYDERGGTLEAERCSQAGVIAPLLGVIGSIQALEILKLLAGAGHLLAGRLLLLDALSMELRTVRLRRDPACPVCAQVPRPPA